MQTRSDRRVSTFIGHAYRPDTVINSIRAEMCCVQLADIQRLRVTIHRLMAHDLQPPREECSIRSFSDEPAVVFASDEAAFHTLHRSRSR